MVLFAVGDATFASSHVWLVCAGIFVAGFAISWFIVGYATAIQLRTPQRLQGRVASAAGTIIGVPQTIGIALGAGLVAVLDYRALVAIMAVSVASCGMYLLTRGPEPVLEEEPAVAA
jgi:MFS family permease